MDERVLGSLDSYQQMSVELDDDELDDLVIKWEVTGKLWRTDHKYFPITIRVKEDIQYPWAGALPEGSLAFVEKYEVRIPVVTLQAIAERKGVSIPYPGNMRMVYIHREEV